MKKALLLLAVAVMSTMVLAGCSPKKDPATTPSATPAVTDSATPSATPAQ